MKKLESPGPREFLVSLNPQKIGVPKKLKPLFFIDNRFYAIEGGRGGGKSHTVAIYLIMCAMDRPLRILCTREVQKSINDSAHHLFQEIIRENNLESNGIRPGFRIQKSRIFHDNGSEFIFHGIRNGIKEGVKSMEDIDIAWIEEAQHLSHDSLDIIIHTTRKDGSKIIATYNRQEEDDPIHSNLVISGRLNVLHIKINYYDNPFCPQALIDEANFMKKSSPGLYAHVFEGEPIYEEDNAIMSSGKSIKDHKFGRSA